MKKKLVVSILLIFCKTVTAQETVTSENNDIFRVVISTIIPEDLTNIPESSKATIRSKLGTAITKTGIGNSDSKNQFQLVVNPTLISQKVVPNSPVFVLSEFDLNLYLVDVFNKNILTSESLVIKGSGNSENEAFINAFRSISTSNKILNSFLTTGKNKIVEYYKKNCPISIKKAAALEANDNLNEALDLLSAMPEVNEDCFDKVIAEINRIRLKNVNLECKQLISKAKINWGTKQTLEGAMEASKFLIIIPRSENCFSEVNILLNEIKSKLNTLETREWEFQMKKWSSAVEIEKLYIEAHRDVGVSYGNNQPQTITNFKGWLY